MQKPRRCGRRSDGGECRMSTSLIDDEENGEEDDGSVREAKHRVDRVKAHLTREPRAPIGWSATVIR
jgi:hypothetical protein